MMGRLRELLRENALLRHGSILISAAMVSHVCNMLFQLFMGRLLSGVEYALLCTLLSLANMAVLPMGAIYTAISHGVRTLVMAGREGDVSRLVRCWLVRLGGVGLLFFVGSVVFVDPLASFFNLEREAPIVVMGFVLLLVFCSVTVNGASNGLQVFRSVMIAQQIAAVIRVGAAVLFIQVIAAAAGWGLLGHALGIGLNLLLLLFFLWHRLRGKQRSSLVLPSIKMQVLLNFGFLLAYAFLLRADMILVKHFVPDEATQFAYATTLGHLVIFLPLPLATAMFPKAVSEGRSSQEQRRVFVQALCYTSACLAPAVLFCSLASWIPLRIFFGIIDPSRDLLHMVAAMSWVIMPLGLVHIFIYYCIAQKQYKQMLPILFFALFYFVAVLIDHASVWRVILWAAVSTWGCFLSSLVWVFFFFNRGHKT
tara:strand:+ start:504 stop:1775 length:1272 start_codon:yes stop_codon:yes gene_type:complete